MNDAGKTVRELRGCTAKFTDSKRGKVLKVTLGLVLTDVPSGGLEPLMCRIDRVQQRVIEACANEFLP